MALHPEDTLTPREFEAVALLARGLRYADIGREMSVGPQGVAHYFRGVRAKTGMDNMVAIAVWFVRKYQTEDDEAAGYERACKSSVSREMRRRYGMRDLGR